MKQSFKRQFSMLGLFSIAHYKNKSMSKQINC